jgi:ABC-type antimicrobial peptide transport system permease subunit
VFRLGYIAQELLRRRGRAVLTALGLGLGIALVVAVTSLSRGLDRAQDQVFAPLAGVGTDLLVSRPIDLGGKGGGGAGFAAIAALPKAEQKALQNENQDAFVDPATLGKPGDPFVADSFLPATQLTFPEALAGGIGKVPVVADVGRALTVLLVHAEGKVPAQRGAGFSGGDIQISTATVAGVQAGRPRLGLITPRQITRGRFLAAHTPRREAVLAESYAARRKLRVGSALELDKQRYHVVGIARPPIGTQTADVYLDLPVLQRVAKRKGRVNLLLVRARKGTQVAGLQKTVEKFIPGIVAASSKDLADTVQGSLVGAQDLRGRLATLLAIVALVASIGIAALLVLASVAKRTRELGTLRALGWTRARVVGLVLGESAALGLFGAVIGTALGIGAAALVSAVVPPLKATAQQALDFSAVFGAGQSKPPTARIPLEAPVDARLVVLSVVLAIAAGLLAGAAGAIRAARLRPAEALRRLD